MNRTIRRKVLILTLAISIVLCCSSFIHSIGAIFLGNARLFNNTPMESIQNKIFFGDTIGLRAELRTMTAEEINFQEEKLGATILNWACYSNFEDGASMLIEYGANPNIATHDGWTPLLSSVGLARNCNTTSQLLFAGADPYYGIKDTLKFPSLFSPNYLAARNQLELLKLVHIYGADMNAQDSTLFRTSPLAEACFSGRMENACYLIFECHVDFDYRFGRKSDGSYYYIADVLRELDFELGSKEHSEKMKLVEFLKEHGIDYFKAPVPDWIKQKYNLDYLSRY